VLVRIQFWALQKKQSVTAAFFYFDAREGVLAFDYGLSSNLITVYFKPMALQASMLPGVARDTSFPSVHPCARLSILLPIRALLGEDFLLSVHFGEYQLFPGSLHNGHGNAEGYDLYNTSL
jgi:hypothetical protein